MDNTEIVEDGGFLSYEEAMAMEMALNKRENEALGSPWFREMMHNLTNRYFMENQLQNARVAPPIQPLVSTHESMREVVNSITILRDQLMRIKGALNGDVIDSSSSEKKEEVISGIGPLMASTTEEIHGLVSTCNAVASDISNLIS